MPELTTPPAEGKAAPVDKKDEYASTYEEAKSAIAKANHITVDIQDPVLCVVTVNNLYLGHLNLLLNRHSEAFRGFMGEASKGMTQCMTQSFEKEIKMFADTLKEKALENVLAGIAAHQKAMDGFQTEMRVLTENTKQFAKQLCLTALGGSLLLVAVIICLARGVL
jgi:uncharacterized coiled-coil protein SlyX